MPLHLKLNEKLDERRRQKILSVLTSAGFEVKPLFSGQQRPSLASIYSIAAEGKAKLSKVQSLLAPFDDAIDYLEMTPERKPM